jgi:hypothetical protein
MKTIPRKVLVSLAFSIGLLTLAIWITFFRSDPPDLSKAICQPEDLGERYVRSSRPPVLAKSYLDLGKTVIESYTVELVDLQLTYTVLECSIIRYTDEISARRAFEKVCGDRSELSPPPAGEEACDFRGSAPRNLVFRRDTYLVLMSGDVFVFPAKAVDERLR